jgi:membrane-bound serine protease (ClpP class)
LLLAAGFFTAEAFVVSHGALTLAGAVSFVFGALMLFDPAGPAYQVSLPVAIAIAGTIGAFILFALTKAVAARRSPVEVGVHGLVGQMAVVRRPGYVFANGELWHAEGDEGLRPGAEVVIEEVDGLTVHVRPVGSREMEPAT